MAVRLGWPRTFWLSILGIYIFWSPASSLLAYTIGFSATRSQTHGLASFSDHFFFSMETLATVGYGEMYPATFYGHVRGVEARF